MSFVICLATSSYGIMMSDGRVMNDNVIIREDYQKYVCLNDELIIGYAGDAQFCTSCIALSFPELKCGSSDVLFAFQKVYDKAFAIIHDSRLTKPITSMFLFLGKNRNDTLQIKTLQIIDNCFEVLDFLPSSEKDIRYACAGTDAISNTTMLLSSSIHAKNGHIIEGLKEAIRVVSTKDESVNNNIFYYTIGQVPVLIDS